MKTILILPILFAQLLSAQTLEVNTADLQLGKEMKKGEKVRRLIKLKRYNGDFLQLTFKQLKEYYSSEKDIKVKKLIKQNLSMHQKLFIDQVPTGHKGRVIDINTREIKLDRDMSTKQKALTLNHLKTYQGDFTNETFKKLQDYRSNETDPKIKGLLDENILLHRENIILPQITMLSISYKGLDKEDVRYQTIANLGDINLNDIQLSDLKHLLNYEVSRRILNLITFLVSRRVNNKNSMGCFGISEAVKMVRGDKKVEVLTRCVAREGYWKHRSASTSRDLKRSFGTFAHLVSYCLRKADMPQEVALLNASYLNFLGKMKRPSSTECHIEEKIVDDITGGGSKYYFIHSSFNKHKRIDIQISGHSTVYIAPGILYTDSHKRNSAVVKIEEWKR